MRDSIVGAALLAALVVGPLIPLVGIALTAVWADWYTRRIAGRCTALSDSLDRRPPLSDVTRRAGCLAIGVLPVVGPLAIPIGVIAAGVRPGWLGWIVIVASTIALALVTAAGVRRGLVRLDKHGEPELIAGLETR